MSLDVTPPSTAADHGLLGDYGAVPGRRDVLVDASGAVREHWQRTVGALDALGLQELRGRKVALDRMLDEEGIGYRLVEEGRTTRWSLDPLPVLVESAEWASIERGVIQRAVLLDLIQRDLYGPRDLIRRGLLPPEIVFGHPGHLMACHDICLPTEQQLFLYAADLVVDGDGRHVVLADRTQAPSGAGYALANRIMISRIFPSLYRDSQVHRVAPYFRSLRAGLERVAERITGDEPRIVVLTPGPGSETAFEHAYVGSYLGYPVVEGADLTVSGGRVHLRALGRLEPVDVILRRVDADWCDPLELRPDSQLGIPGLVEATRRGAVAVVNPLGAGVLENPALAVFLPALAQHLLGQDLQLPSAATWWCGDDRSRSHVLANLDSLVVKPLSRPAGATSIFAAELDLAGRDELRRRIEARPDAWVAQDAVVPATAPSLAGAGVVPRPTTLRTFAVARNDSYAVMPGGLTRVGADLDRGRISNQHGASSKDTWVLASEPEPTSEFWLRSGPATAPTDPTTLSPRAAENLFWLGRYAERAEAATRLLRVVHDRRNDVRRSAVHTGVDPAVDVTVRVLLGALTVMTGTGPGFVGDGADAALADPETELHSLACDAGRAGTLANSVRRMLLAAESVRDQLSLDTWLVVGSMEDELRAIDRHGQGPPAIVQQHLGRVLQQLLALNGLAADSMVRDAGWHFLDAGRRIERATQLTALLRATLGIAHDAATDSLLYESVLTAGESIITYRRRYRSHARTETLLDLLVADRGNPRSLRHQADRLVTDLDAMPRANPAARPAGAARIALELATRLAVIDTSELAALDDEGRRSDLDVVLGEVQTALWRAADAVRDEHFGPTLRQQSLTRSTGWDPSR